MVGSLRKEGKTISRRDLDVRVVRLRITFDLEKVTG